MQLIGDQGVGAGRGRLGCQTVQTAIIMITEAEYHYESQRSGQLLGGADPNYGHNKGLYLSNFVGNQGGFQ